MATQVKFNSMYGVGVVKTAQDLSNPMEDVFEELPPFAMDSEGNILNKSSFPKLVKTGQVNVQERIQSYADEVDIYKIIERMALSGDTFEGMDNKGLVYDYSNLPDNIHDFENYIGDSIAALKAVSPELAQVVLNKDSSTKDIEVAIDNYVNSKVKKTEANK